MEPQMAISLAKELCEMTVHAFGRGTLSADGSQYGTSYAATSTDTWKVVDTQSIQPFVTGGFGEGGSIIEVEFNLVANVRHASTAAGGAVTYAWQAKNLSATSTDSWIWLTPTSSGLSTACSTAFDVSLSGYMTLSNSTFNAVPFQVRLLIVSAGGSTAGDSATGAYAKAKNSSYVRVIYRVT